MQKPVGSVRLMLQSGGTGHKLEPRSDKSYHNACIMELIFCINILGLQNIDPQACSRTARTYLNDTASTTELYCVRKHERTILCLTMERMGSCLILCTLQAFVSRDLQKQVKISINKIADGYMLTARVTHAVPACSECV
jgi:hypothetical protein